MCCKIFQPGSGEWVARAPSSPCCSGYGRGALDALATGLYSHVRPERLPYDSPLSQHFAKTRQLGERTEKFDGRLDELCRDTIKNTIISLIYGDQSHDHSEAVRYELTKLEKLDAQCWIISAAEKYLEDRQ